MNLLKPLLSSTALTALAFAPVPADAQPIMAPFSWAGFYVGLNAGGAWGRSTYTDLAAIYVVPTNTNRLPGVIGGVQAGYNWQTGSFVFGLEGDVAFLSASKNTAFFTPFLAHNSRISALATLRGRVGVAMDHTLLYVTGGAAVASIKNQFVDTGPPLTANRSSATWGWAAGFGVERAFGEAWSAKLEFIHAGFPTERVVPAPGFLFALEDSVSIVRAGLNFHF